MVSAATIEQQLKQLGFNYHGWGRAEVKELQHILVAGEQIYECVNGVYEGGFALLVATDVRVLLVDKKPLNYLTIEDLRFDMINEIDYSHRLTGARINIATGSKNLKFMSYNQPRLRKLINHIQRCMAESKKQQSSHQEDQNQHLEQINQQLQVYLAAQYQYQQQAQALQLAPPLLPAVTAAPQLVAPTTTLPTTATQLDDAYTDGLQEVFGRQFKADTATGGSVSAPMEITVNPLRVAYAKLPLILRHRKFGRLSLATH